MDVPAEVLQILKCSRCEAYLSLGPVYLQHDGAAVCGRCFAPERPATRMPQYEAMAKLVRFRCRNQAQGCTHTDINAKCLKHEKYFCQQRPMCSICRQACRESGCSRTRMYEAGDTWQASLSYIYWRRYHLSSVAGRAVCCYRLNVTSFLLRVYTPVSSERLSEFRCTVRLTHRDTGHTHTYTPDACYTKRYDWCIEVRSAEFPSWRGIFDVCVDIAKAGTE